METVSRETSPLDPYWVTGFSDGEASFTYSRQHNQMAVYYAVKLTAVDEPVLEELQRFFNAGRIYAVSARAPNERGGGATKTASYFRIHRREELIRVVEHFDRYPLRSTKKNVYEVWRLMALAKHQFGSPDRELMEALACRVTELCVRKQPWR